MYMPGMGKVTGPGLIRNGMATNMWPSRSLLRHLRNAARKDGARSDGDAKLAGHRV